MLRIWNDNRSGFVGCLAGNTVLAEVQGRETIVHEKGTVFSTPTRLFVCRSSARNYLQDGLVHLCNISKNQVSTVAKCAKKTYFLFITRGADGTNLHYWKVPVSKVSMAVKYLKPKSNSDSTCFLRIHEKDGRFILGNSDINISRYHSVKLLNRRTAAKFAKAAAADKAAQSPGKGKEMQVA